MTKKNNLTRLYRIASLKENWNGYGAKQFSEGLIKTCKALVNVLALQPAIFPTGRESIQFEYERKDGSYLEFEIFEDHVLCLEIPQRIYSKAQIIEIPLSEIGKVKEIVETFYEQNKEKEIS